MRLQILSKPDGDPVFQADTSLQYKERILYIDEAYMYVEISTNDFEELRPYDIRIDLYGPASSQALHSKVIRSVVLNKPNENHNGKEFEVHIC